MEEISGTKSHKLILNNRRTGSFTGILDVLSFDVGEILLETELGMLDLKGKDLHVNRLNLEKGEADIEGEIDMITYSKVPEVTGKKDKKRNVKHFYHSYCFSCDYDSSGSAAKAEGICICRTKGGARKAV